MARKISSPVSVSSPNRSAFLCYRIDRNAIDIEDTLAFSVLENVCPMIETVPLAQAADAYARMMAGKARFRMVLVTGQ